ncbi:hypothetical protein GN316_12575 [Xylophilus sp. Kf1]|nr:hypothetical protein [Xylophilus sp. Kf1]
MNRQLIKSNEYAEKCSRWIRDKEVNIIGAEINFTNASAEAMDSIYLSKSMTDAPGYTFDFLPYNTKTRRMWLDRNKLAEWFDGAPAYSGRASEMLSEGGEFFASAKFTQARGTAANYVIAEVFYVNSLTGKKWQDAYFSFFVPGVVSVFYWPSVLLTDSKADKEFVAKMKKLFMSMRVVKNKLR